MNTLQSDTKAPFGKDNYYFTKFLINTLIQISSDALNIGSKLLVGDYRKIWSDAYRSGDSGDGGWASIYCPSGGKVCPESCIRCR